MSSLSGCTCLRCSQCGRMGVVAVHWIDRLQQIRKVECVCCKHKGASGSHALSHTLKHAELNL